MKNYAINLSNAGWRSTSLNERSLFVRGKPIFDGATTGSLGIEKALLAAELLPLDSILSKLNGFYAWIEARDDSIRAGVDHVRSIPLFYAQINNLLFLSDDAEWVRRQAGVFEIDPTARDEFLIAGYVTGPDTLYAEVKQLQAGEYLEAIWTSSKLSVRTKRYFRFWHEEPTVWDPDRLREEIDEVALEVFKDLAAIANGRQIVVPLSGGYDSRLVATLLRRVGCENVLCVAYGIAGNKEARYSKEVASQLGFEWEFVEYSPRRWNEHWSSSAADTYRAMGSNHSSLPHVQDWLAMKILTETGRIERGAIVVPGHTGDFVAGGHIPNVVFTKERHREEELFDELIYKNFSSAPRSGGVFADDEVLNERIRDRIAAEFDGSPVCFANLYELWDWQERQAKYIVNSVRVYDQFGLDWWLPLWDMRFLKFWQRAPLSLRRQRRWYCAWVTSLYSETVVTNAQSTLVGNASDRNRLASVLIGLLKMLPSPLINMAKGVQSSVDARHPLSFESLVTDGSFASYRRKGYSLMGVYAKLFLEGRWRQS